MNVRETTIDGCVELIFAPSIDRRGMFLKLFQESAFDEFDLDLRVREVFVAYSHPGVVRGLHFQLPPKSTAKLVVCLMGSALDAVVDLRTGSPTFGQHITIQLSAEQCNAILVPEGCAHGYATINDEALLGYAVSEEFDPRYDSGIHWASAGIGWPLIDPIISDRDATLVTLEQFESPFVYVTSTSGT